MNLIELLKNNENSKFKFILRVPRKSLNKNELKHDEVCCVITDKKGFTPILSSYEYDSKNILKFLRATEIKKNLYTLNLDFITDEMCEVYDLDFSKNIYIKISSFMKIEDENLIVVYIDFASCS